MEGRALRSMGAVVFAESEVKDQLKKIKRNKQPGSDRIKGEMFKWKEGSDLYVNILTKSVNKILQAWRCSKTVLVPKKNKPQVKDFRPITLTNVGYKLYYESIKRKK